MTFSTGLAICDEKACARQQAGEEWTVTSEGRYTAQKKLQVAQDALEYAEKTSAAG